MAADKTTEDKNSLEEHILQNESAQIVKQILSELSAEEQIVIRLHFYNNMSLQQIAHVLNKKNLWQVHRKIKKILKILKKKLQDKGFHPSDLGLPE